MELHRRIGFLKRRYEKIIARSKLGSEPPRIFNCGLTRLLQTSHQRFTNQSRLLTGGLNSLAQDGFQLANCFDVFGASHGRLQSFRGSQGLVVATQSLDGGQAQVGADQ